MVLPGLSIYLQFWLPKDPDGGGTQPVDLFTVWIAQFWLDPEGGGTQAGWESWPTSSCPAPFPDRLQAWESWESLGVGDPPAVFIFYFSMIFITYILKMIFGSCQVNSVRPMVQNAMLRAEILL